MQFRDTRPHASRALRAVVYGSYPPTRCLLMLQPELNVTVPTWTPWSWTALDERMMLGAIMVGAIMMGAHGVARHGVAIEEVKRLGLPEGRVGFCAATQDNWS